MKHILKSKKNISKFSFINYLSPNYSKRNKNKIKYVIIHYTGMKSLQSCLKKFKDSNSKVSCHWLISKNGKIYKIVDEKKCAWHAGISSWRNEKMLNKSSIGIELDNPGHGSHYTKYSKIQMKSLEKLLQVILSKYNIDIKNVLGHSDISPTRKADPGELFCWSTLAKKRLAYWPSKKIQINKNIFLCIGDMGYEVLNVKKKLKKIGYSCTANNKFDLVLKATIEAFQRRFCPEQVNGIIDKEVYEKIENIYKST